MFWKKKEYKDFVDTSLGRLYIRPLRNKDLDGAFRYSTVVKNGVSNARFFYFCERRMVQLPFWKWGKLTLDDGEKIRKKIIIMLKKNGVVFEDKNNIEDSEKEFNPHKQITSEDIDWFKQSRQRQKGMVGNGKWQ